jgi:hypothetical protein
MTKGHAVTKPTEKTAISFEETRLPAHPTIEHTFEELRRLDTADEFTTRGIKIAQLIAADSPCKDPDAIAAGLLVPLASDHGPVLLAKAALPERVGRIIQSLFDFGGLALSAEDTEAFYAGQPPAVRSVILAASARMFEVTAKDMEKIAAQKDPALQTPQDSAYLTGTIDALRHFTDMISRVEKSETALVEKCRNALERIERALDDRPQPAAAPGRKPKAPKP